MKFRSIELWSVVIGILLLSAKALLYTSSLGQILLFWLFFLVYVLFPGYMLFQLVFPDEKEWLTVLGMSWASGLALLTGSYLISKIIGISNYFVLYPLILVPFVIKRIQTKGQLFQIDFEQSPNWPYLLGLLFIGSLAITAALYYSPRILLENGGAIHGDIIYHTGNITELRNHWPMQDPRIAGMPLRYFNFFSHGFPAALSQIMNIPVYVVVLQILPGFSSALLLIQSFNAGRKLGGFNLAGLIACVLLLFHTDLGWAATRYLPVTHVLHLRSGLGQAIYESLSTQYGTIYLVTFVWLLLQWLGGRGGLKIALYTILISFVATGAKLTILPVALGGLVLVATGQFITKRKVAKSVLIPLIISGSVALFTLVWLVSDAMLLFESTSNFQYYFNTKVDIFPLATPLANTITNLYGPLPPLMRILFVLVWLVLYPGLTGLGCVLALVKQKQLEITHWWMIASYVVGATLMLTIQIAAHDERSLIDHGVTLLALVGAQGIAHTVQPFDRKKWVAFGLVLLFSIPTGLYALQMVRGGLYRDSVALRTLTAPKEEIITDYLDGMTWLRSETSPDCLLIVNHEGVFVSIYAERRIFFEQKIGATEFSTDSYSERLRLNESLYESLTSENIARVFEYAEDVYYIVDNLEFKGNYGEKGIIVKEVNSIPALSSDHVELVYSNQAIQIYQLKP